MENPWNQRLWNLFISRLALQISLVLRAERFANVGCIKGPRQSLARDILNIPQATHSPMNWAMIIC
uniref:Uncharacterized protein n=1 Tax=Candidatus Kentrum sp. FW TaxID=2126338 RepID=A0A450SLH6_9GAMM|nr:MAG: hypothetical protein BECKFW1821B_GA0114236_10197 [Candidatus Kentron sp. FW]